MHVVPAFKNLMCALLKNGERDVPFNFLAAFQACLIMSFLSDVYS